MTLTWPFFDPAHRGFAKSLATWADANLAALPHDDVDTACRARVRALGEAGFLKAVVAAERSVALAQEALGIVRAQYDAGTATQLDVLQAQDSLVAAEVITDMEIRTGIELPMDVLRGLAGMETVGQVVDYLELQIAPSPQTDRP